MLRYLIIFLSIFAALKAVAQSSPETCKLEGVVELRGPSQYFCFSDFTVESGTVIYTNGFPLQFTVTGKLIIGHDELKRKKRAPRVRDTRPNPNGLSIFSFPKGTPAGHNSGEVNIYANSVSGSLLVDNRGSSPQDTSGLVYLEYISLAPSYKQEITVTGTAPVNLTLNGMWLKLIGPKHEIPLHVQP